MRWKNRRCISHPSRGCRGRISALAEDVVDCVRYEENWSRERLEYMLYILAAVVYGTDQLLKWWVRSGMQVGGAIPVWPGVLSIHYIRNPGAAWSILSGAHGLLIVIALIVIVAVVVIERRYRPNLAVKVALALVLGGALGNLTDRVVFGLVTDYVYFDIINFPVFNLADVSIDAGVILLLWRSFKSGDSRRPSREQLETEEISRKK
jgi:signal peptidase II